MFNQLPSVPPRTGDLRKRILRGLLFFSATVVSSRSPEAIAQSGAGTIQGTVQDATGAVIPNAKVQIVSTGTAIATDATSNDRGFYVVPGLFAGPYRITITAEGMSPYEARIVLNASQVAVIDPKLAIGAATTQITVAGDVTPLANYQDQTISTTLENQRIQQLPINGRTIANLLTITVPGYENGRINGNLAQAFELVQDGAPIANVDIGGAPPRTPDPDSVQEVHVETGDSSAKYNRPGTAVLTTKSGTNQLHGTLFETARNNAIGIAKSRRDITNLVAPKFIRNEFGGNLGGPIVIPHLYNGHDKAFFFFGYERLSLRQASSQLLSVPTLAMRNGDFSGREFGTKDASGNPVFLGGNSLPFKIYDPATTAANGTRTQFVTGGVPNVIPSTRISPLAKQLYAVTQLPTNGNNPYLASNWTGTSPTSTTSPTYTGRIDYHFNENNTGYLRGSYLPYKSFTLNQTGFGPYTTDYAANLTFNPVTVSTGVIGFNHTFSPTFFSETVLGNTWDSEGVLTGPNPYADYADQYGLPNNFGSTIYPNVVGQGLQQYATADQSRNNVSVITNLDENLTLLRGRHQLAFGGRYRHERIGILPDQAPNPSTTNFSGQGTGLLDLTSGTSENAVPNTGNGQADFFLGSASSYLVTKVHGYYHFRQQEISTYLQDDFHARRNLTLNLGVRWEIHPTVHEANHAVAGFDFTNKAIVLGQPLSKLVSSGQTSQSIVNALQTLGVNFEYAGDVGAPLDVADNNFFNFAPRLGLAYRPFGDRHSLVIRGGYGTYIFPVPVRNFYGNARLSSPYTATFQTNYTSAATSPDGLPNYQLRSQQAIIAGANSVNAVSTNLAPFTPGQPSISTVDRHYPVEYAQQSNVTLEQQIPFKTIVRVSYLENDGTNLNQYWEYNTAPSAYASYLQNGNNPLPTGYYANTARNAFDQRALGTIEVSRKTGYSHDYSGQINLQRIFSNGYSFQFFYVYSAAFRNGGNTFRDGFVQPLSVYAPGTGFATQDQENHAINYVRDTAIPKQRLRFTYVIDLPIGKGKKFLGNSNRLVNALLGGFQLAGQGTFVSQLFQPTTANWGASTPTKLYKKGVKVTNCNGIAAGQTCPSGFQYFNGYYTPAQQALVSGLPTGYVANTAPYDTRPTIVNAAGVTVSNPNYLTNNIPFKLTDGSTPNVAISPGPGIQQYSKTFLDGPNNFNLDASLYKVFPITERTQLKINVDAFNALNIQGTTNPNTTTGFVATSSGATGGSSYWTPRQIQISARLQF